MLRACQVAHDFRARYDRKGSRLVSILVVKWRAKLSKPSRPHDETVDEEWNL